MQRFWLEYHAIFTDTSLLLLLFSGPFLKQDTTGELLRDIILSPVNHSTLGQLFCITCFLKCYV